MFSASNNVSTNIWLELNDRAYGSAWIEFPKFVCLFAGNMFLECAADGYK